jgi:hypothetical protein
LLIVIRRAKEVSEKVERGKIFIRGRRGNGRWCDMAASRTVIAIKFARVGECEADEGAGVRSSFATKQKAIDYGMHESLFTGASRVSTMRRGSSSVRSRLMKEAIRSQNDEQVRRGRYYSDLPELRGRDHQVSRLLQRARLGVPALRRQYDERFRTGATQVTRLRSGLMDGVAELIVIG